jgi:hypothetical protein
MNYGSVMNLFADTIQTLKFPRLSQPVVGSAKVCLFEATGRRIG